MAVSISISITQNKQSVANNTSNVTVKVTAEWTRGSWNANSKPGWLKIDGTKYEFSSSFNAGESTSGSQTLFTKTVNVSHKTDGTKTLSCSASYTSGVSSGTVTASASKKLTTIARKSSISSVSGGNLGAASTIKVSRQSTSFTHTLTYKCGTATGTIATKSSSTSISWTPPLSLASQNTKGLDLTVVFTLETFNGSTSLGKNTWTSEAYKIPASSVTPSASISVATDTYKTKYGAYVQGKSKPDIDVTASGAYNATITSYKTEVDGKTYTTSGFTADVLSGSGTKTITTTVTDSRQQSKTVTANIDVLAYSAPKITSMSVKRSTSSGGNSSSGAYLTVTFSSSVSPLSNKNTAAYKIQYKKTTDTAYSSAVALSGYANNYAVTNGTYTFAADTASSYDVLLTVTDEIGIGNKTATGSSISKLWSILAKGKGLAIGKVAELAETLDVAWTAIFRNKVVVFNDKFIFFKDKDGNDTNSIGLNSNNNLLIGYDLYDKALGNTVLYGNNVRINTNYGLYINNEPRFTDGGWIYPAISSTFAAYDADTKPKYRKVDKAVEVTGAIKPASTLTGSTTKYTIFTLPEGCRPSTIINTLCQGSGTAIWLLEVNTTGAVSFARYRNGNSYADANTSTWLPFHVTFFVDSASYDYTGSVTIYGASATHDGAGNVTII